ncbi:hypothetical protein K438DRAFT_2141786 [Mycena galopus ATCC 62051]|nr:hypothetical protein K438DRAFT_2141786 [Mycena galopus ATCC 62051]
MCQSHVGTRQHCHGSHGTARRDTAFSRGPSTSHWDTLQNVDFTPADSTLMGGNLVFPINSNAWSITNILSVGAFYGQQLSDFRFNDQYALPDIARDLMEYLGLDPVSTDEPVLKLHDIENAAVTSCQMEQMKSLRANIDTTADVTCKIEYHGWLDPFNVAVHLHLIPGSAGYERHPDLPNLLSNAMDPTDDNIRAAGLVEVQLLNDTRLVAESALNSLSIAPIKILIHITLLGMLVSGRGSGFIFSFELQNSVSSRIKIAANAVGIKLATGCIMHQYSTLTSIHDQSAAWTGMGSSLSTLAQQLKLPTSALATFSILTYLSAISILHATIPALVSAEIFNMTTLSAVDVNASQNGTAQTIRIAEVNATGFNISCGYLAGSNTVLDATKHHWIYNVSFTTINGWVVVPAPGPDIITFYAMTNSSPSAYPEQPGSVIVYTTSPVVDSTGHTGFPVTLTEGRVNPNIAGLEFLLCSKVLVSQTVAVEGGSRLIDPSTLKPTLTMTLLEGDFVPLLDNPPPQAGIGPIMDGPFGGTFVTSGIDEYYFPAPPDFRWLILPRHLMEQLGLRWRAKDGRTIWRDTCHLWH